MTSGEILTKASARLDARLLIEDRLRIAYEGRSPVAFLSPEAREALRGRLTELPVNLVRVAVDTIAERLVVEGFGADPALWAAWRASGMLRGSQAAHSDSLLTGCGLVSVWTGPDGRTPSIRPESTRQAVVDVDPATGDRRWGVKRWIGADRYGRALVMLPDTVTQLRTAQQLPDAEGQLLPTVGGWHTVDVLDNPLGVVPLVPLVNRPSTERPLGTSEVADVLPLVDAISKLCQDLLVTSEAHSRPRRWASGIEIVTDELGVPENPFLETPSRVWTAESEGARFGEFPPASLQSFVHGTAVLLRMIAAVTAIPPATLGLTSDTPASAEALRASESGLVSRCRLKQAGLGESWSEVGRLALMVLTGRDADPPSVSWADAESRSEIVAADRAAKLSALGVSLESILDDLGWPPDKIAAELDRRRRDVLDNVARDLSGLQL